MTESEEDDETMKLKNTLIVVKDIEKAKRFYHDLFGLEMLRDNDGNMILTDGLVLQEERYWKDFLKREMTIIFQRSSPLWKVTAESIF